MCLLVPRQDRAVQGLRSPVLGGEQDCPRKGKGARVTPKDGTGANASTTLPPSPSGLTELYREATGSSHEWLRQLLDVVRLLLEEPLYSRLFGLSQWLPPASHLTHGQFAFDTVINHQLTGRAP